MAHEWSSGVLVKSSWHGLEKVAPMPDAASMVEAGQASLAWPVDVTTAPLVTADGLSAPGVGIVSSYRDGSRVCHGVGKGYTPLGVDAWRETIEAAVAAGAKPAGAFALRGGARILATFELPTDQAGRGDRADKLAGYLTVIDGLDGETPHVIGASWVDVVCANTLALAFGSNLQRGDLLRTKHTRRIADRATLMREAMVSAIATGETIKHAYRAACEAPLTPKVANDVMHALHPVPALADDKSNQAAVTRALNRHDDLRRAASLEVNNMGATVASLWNAATFLVDRTSDGEARPMKSGDPLDSLLMGDRGKRVERIREVLIPVIEAATGETIYMSAPEASSHGIDDAQLGRALIDDML